LNLYAYVYNSPISFIDPYGLFRWRPGQFFMGVAWIVSGAFTAALGLALAPASGGLSAFLEVPAAGAIGWGVGNMVAAFAPDKVAATEMWNCPKTPLGVIAKATDSDHTDTATDVGDTYEEIPEAFLGSAESGSPAELLLSLIQAGAVILGSNSGEEENNYFLQDW
jgi:hypothetical protein